MSHFCYCGARTIVVDTRQGISPRYGAYIRRRRRCDNGHRFTSMELPNVLVNEITKQAIAMSKARALLLSVTPDGTLPSVAKVPLPPDTARLGSSDLKRHVPPRQMAVPVSKRCGQCKEPFTTKRTDSRFCCADCRRAYHARGRTLEVQEVAA